MDIKQNYIHTEAQKYFGMTFAGLTIDFCNFDTFRSWYTSTRGEWEDPTAIYVIYAAALYIWENYE